MPLTMPPSTIALASAAKTILDASDYEGRVLDNPQWVDPRTGETNLPEQVRGTDGRVNGCVIVAGPEQEPIREGMHVTVPKTLDFFFFVQHQEDRGGGVRSWDYLGEQIEIARWALAAVPRLGFSDPIHEVRCDVGFFPNGLGTFQVPNVDRVDGGQMTVALTVETKC